MKLKDLADGARDLLMFHPENLYVEEGFNIREDYGDLETLAEDIAANGVRVPLEIRLDADNKRALVCNGHRRHRACMLLLSRGVEIKAVPCIPEPRGTSPAERLAAQFTCNTGKPLEPFEERSLFVRLGALGWEPKQIATKIGRSVTFVLGRLDLGNATVELAAAVKDKKLSATAAQKLAKASPEVQRKTLAEAAPGKRVRVGEAAKAAGAKTKKKRMVCCPHCEKFFDLNKVKS